jgi:hypothetical protein
MTDIVIVNTSTLFSDATVASLIPALQKQVSGDFAPLWDLDGTLHFDTQDPGNIPYRVILKDIADDPNDLGFHLLDNGNPEARIFCQGTPQDQLASVMGHEILEMLADPQANRMAPDGRHIIEVGDPVEENGYMIDGVFVTDFVTPAYFGFNSDTRYDFSRQLTGPCPLLLPAGYIMELTEGGWVSHFGRRADGTINERALEAGRSRWRASRPVTNRLNPLPANS